MADPIDLSLADAELTAFVEGVRRDPGPPARAVGVAELRRAQRLRVQARPPGPDIARVEDLTVGSKVRARLYAPAARAQPLVVFLHGGMWTIGDLESHDRACRRLAAKTGLAVLSVDSRRAPEHPWPAAVDDCVAVIRWIAEGGGSSAVIGGPTIVMGDSSGGNHAALTCLRLRDDGGPLPAAQILAYPGMVHGFLTLDTVSPAAAATGDRLFADVAELVSRLG